jgi:hypothetical protein
MGRFEKWRNFLLNILSSCFFSSLPDGKEFCVNIVDLMQFLRGSVGNGGGTFSVDAITRKMEETTSYYQNNRNDPKRPIIKKKTIVLLDSFNNVPRNKGITQRDRDGAGENPHMNEELYNQMVSLHPLMGDLFFLNNPSAFKYPLDGVTVWRSINLKLQLYRLITFHLIHSEVSKGKELVIDDGFAFSTTVYQREREKMLQDHGFESRSAFEQDALVHQLILENSSEFCHRFTVFEGMAGEERDFERAPSTGAGEGDVKVHYYLKRGLDEDDPKKFLIVNQDTDLIPILLMHMSSLLVGDESDKEIEVWLDTRSPVDYGKPNRPYRYIDIKALYYGIKELFAKEYPSIISPIETFCFLIFTVRTDFTQPFPSSLCINEALVWDTFSQLHATPRPEGWIKFGAREGMGLKRMQPFFKPATMSDIGGVLNYAVQYDTENQRFFLDHDALAKFYYFMIQLTLKRVRKDLNLPIGERVLPPEELLIYGHDVSERLTLFQQRQQRLQNQINDALLSRTLTLKPSHIECSPILPTAALAQPEPEPEPEPEPRLKLSSKLKGKKPIKIVLPDEVEDIEDDEEEQVKETRGPGFHIESHLLSMDSYLIKNEKALARCGKRGAFAIPTMNEMKARLKRKEWYIDYARHGGFRVIPPTETAKCDPSLSLWGWKALPIEDARKALNCTYFISCYDPSLPNAFQLFDIQETDEVYHKC